MTINTIIDIVTAGIIEFESVNFPQGGENGSAFTATIGFKKANKVVRKLIKLLESDGFEYSHPVCAYQTVGGVWQKDKVSFSLSIRFGDSVLVREGEE